MRWPQIRAGLIALAIAFGLIDGLPLPPPDKTPAWERGAVEVVRRGQRTLEWPVAWLGRRLRVSQQWALYQAPQPERWRLCIDGRDAYGRWHILYRAGDAEHTEDAPILESGRLRVAWDITDRPSGQFDAFADWITARVLAHHRDFTTARLRMEKVHLSEAGVTPTGEFAFTHIRDRGGLP